MKGFFIFLLAVVLIIVGALGLIGTVIGSLMTQLSASVQGMHISLAPAIILGIIFLYSLF